MLGIAGLTLMGCGTGPEEAETSPATDETVSREADESIRLFGAVSFSGDQAVLMGEDEESCMIADPSTTVVVNHLESAEVLIENDRGETIETTEFQTFHDEERCSWLIDVEVDSGSEYFVAHFNDMSTPKAHTSDFESDFLELDVTTPVSNEIEDD